MSTVSAPSRVALAPVLLHVGRAALGRQQDLVPDQQAELTALMVGVCLDNGQRDEAMKLAETLLKREATAEQLATAAARLQAIPRRDTRQLARKLWLSVESRSQPGSEPWLNARLHVASCALAVGDLEQCRKLLHVTRLLYPQLGNPSLHSRFEALEKQAAGQ